MKKLLVLFVAALVFASHAVADEARASTTDAEALVKTAVAYLKRHGREKAFKEFQNPSGPFVYRDLYIFVYDMNGKCVSHGADPSRIGKDLSGQKDPDGKLFVQERMALAKSKGSGWQDYKFKNPATGKVEAKTAYVEKFEDLIVGSGAYKP